MLRRAVALALTAAGLVAPPATAAVVPLAPSARVLDAALSGPDVLTLEHTSRQDVVLRARPITGGPAVTRATFRRPKGTENAFVDLDADGGQVAVRLQWLAYPNDETQDREAEVLLGPAAGPLTSVARWSSGGRGPRPMAIALDAGRLAVAETTAASDGGQVRVREPDGTWLVVPGAAAAVSLDLRGDLVAGIVGFDRDEERVEVRDRTTGAVVRSTPDDAASDLALGPDGALVVGRRPSQRGGVVLAAPADGPFRPLGGSAALGGRVLLTANHAVAGESTRAGDRPVVVPLAGGTPRAVGPRTASLSFELQDATEDHVLWSTETCLVVAATGDPAPAALPPGPCARSEAFVLAVERGAQVTCLTAPGRGCRVTLRLSGRRNRTLGRRTVVVPVATTRTYDVPVPRRVLRRQPRSEDGRFAFVTLTAYATDPQGRRHPATEPEDVAIELR